MSIDLTDRCTGHCCRDFFFCYSPIELQHQKKRALIKKSKSDFAEMIQIADMLIFLRSDYLAHGQKTGALVHHYTCKNFDGRNCTIYEQRPKMCSLYPYGKECRYPKCACMTYKYPLMKSVVGSRIHSEHIKETL